MFRIDKNISLLVIVLAGKIRSGYPWNAPSVECSVGGRRNIVDKLSGSDVVKVCNRAARVHTTEKSPINPVLLEYWMSVQIYV